MANKLTLLDLAKRKGNDVTIGIIEAMTQSNALLKQIPFRGIIGNTLKYGRRVGLPTVAWKGINQGVDASKSIIEDVVMECKFMGGRSQVGKNLIEQDPRGINAVRMEEDSSFLAAMSNLFNYAMFYGNSVTNKLMPDGIIKLLSSVAAHPTCISATGSASNVQTSMYIVSFADAIGVGGISRGVEGLLGNGKLPTGLDMGLQYIDDLDSKQMLGYVTEFDWQPGFAIYDERSVARICNIDSTHKITAPLINQAITAMLPFQPSAIFMNKQCLNYLQELKTSSIHILVDDNNPFKRIYAFDGIPVFFDENIVNTEAVVS
jgi:hypothetical protein